MYVLEMDAVKENIQAVYLLVFLPQLLDFGCEVLHRPFVGSEALGECLYGLFEVLGLVVYVADQGVEDIDEALALFQQFLHYLTRVDDVGVEDLYPVFDLHQLLSHHAFQSANPVPEIDLRAIFHQQTIARACRVLMRMRDVGPCSGCVVQ